MQEDKEKVWMIKYLKICSIGMMVLGILLCCGGAWIIQDDVTSLIGCINITMSLVLLCTAPDDCLGCMILNYCITLTLGMSLSFGASVITYLRYSEALNIPTEIIYHYMTLYFMGLGFLFALIIAGLLGISYGIRRQKLNLFSFKTIEEA